ncbi:hypothetical protein D9M70_650240 [compost metagenome]
MSAELRDFLGAPGGLVEGVGDAGDIGAHVRLSLRASRSRATSTIMSSWPPTMRRRPSSTRMSRVFRPYFAAAISA